MARAQSARRPQNQRKAAAAQSARARPQHRRLVGRQVDDTVGDDQVDARIRHARGRQVLDLALRFFGRVVLRGFGGLRGLEGVRGGEGGLRGVEEGFRGLRRMAGRRRRRGGEEEGGTQRGGSPKTLAPGPPTRLHEAHVGLGVAQGPRPLARVPARFGLRERESGREPVRSACERAPRACAAGAGAAAQRRQQTEAANESTAARTFPPPPAARASCRRR